MSTPYLLAWFIRTGLCALMFIALLYEGMTYVSLSLWGAQLAGGFSIIVVTTLKHGKLGRLSRTDITALCLASVGALAWATSGSAIYSVLGVIVADAVATVIGIRAARLHGHIESVWFWMFALCAAVLTLSSVDKTSFVMALAPMSSVLNALTNAAVVLWIVRQRKAVGVSAA